MSGRAASASLTVIGLMSGTSTDGVTAAVVRLRPRGHGYAHRLLACRTWAFAPSLRQRILAVAEGTPLPVAALSELNAALGEVFARAALAAARAAAVPLARVDLIGSHGHTVFHGPPGSGLSRPPSTLQIGEPAVIAARTGVTTVADFRPADIAAGGQGAPLAPYVHWLLFTHPRLGRAIHNVGGIANLTYLPPAADLEEVIAFDTGPGNMVMDALVARASGGRETFDRGGRLAASGRVHAGLLAELMRHPYLRKRPPKSTGREEFGAAVATGLARRARRLRLSAADTVATATAWTAESMADAYRRFVLRRGRLDAIHLAGGGARNRTLVRFLTARLPGITVGTLEDLGADSHSLEAIAFAVLAAETVRGRAANVPSVTGARRRTVLGKIVPAPGRV